MLTRLTENIKVAAVGWKNLAFKNDHVEMLYAGRARVCSNCEHVKGPACGLCGCPLAARLRAVEASCPDGRW